VKFLSEYTRTFFSEVAVAMRGKSLGFGMDTQARTGDLGLNSAMEVIRTPGGVEEAIVVVMKENLEGKVS
jgi:hypothetical protein